LRVGPFIIARRYKYALDSGDTVLAGRVIPLLCRAIRVWRNRGRLMCRFGPRVLDAFFWRHFLALSEMLAQPIVGNVAAETFRRSLVRWQDRLFVFLVAGCEFQAPQKGLRLISVNAINFMP
jgi:hypothetical protein